MRLDYIHTDEQMADIFSKALSRHKFEKFRDQMELKKNPFLAKLECGDWKIVSLISNSCS